MAENKQKFFDFEINETKIWLPKETVQSKYPQITTYNEMDVWLAPIPPHLRGTLSIAGESKLSPSTMEEKVLEAAYDGIISNDDNLAFRLADDNGYRVIGIEYPIFYEPASDNVGLGILKDLREAISELADFKFGYFIPLNSKILPQAELYQGLLVGHINDKKPKKGLTTYIHSTVSKFEDAVPVDKRNLPYPDGIPKLSDVK